MGIEGKKKVEVTERRGRNVTGIMKKKEPENKGMVMRIKKIMKGNGNRG